MDSRREYEKDRQDSSKGFVIIGESSLVIFGEIFCEVIFGDFQSSIGAKICNGHFLNALSIRIVT